MDACPETKLWKAYQIGNLSLNQAARLRVHLESCDKCASLIRTVQPHDGHTVSAAETVDSSDAPITITQTGDQGRIGRPSASTVLQPEELPQLEGYDIVKLVGQGGMGRVYEAFQQSTGRRVAVKFLLEYTSATEDARHRFEREVELVVRLEHPNIVSVIDSGILKGRYYYVMEFVDGQPLDHMLRPGKCDAREVMRVVQGICGTVDYAH